MSEDFKCRHLVRIDHIQFVCLSDSEEDPIPPSLKKAPKQRKKKEVSVIVDSGNHSFTYFVKYIS